MPGSANDDLIDLETDLPPLDGEDDDQRVEVDAELSIDIGTSEQVGLDDDVATDLDVGIAIEEPTDAASDESAELVLDIAELLDRADEREHQDDGGLGPREFDPAIGIDELPEAPADGPDEGVDDAADENLDEQLPNIDGDTETEDEPSVFELESDLDDDLPNASERLWAERSLGEPIDSCVAIDVTESGWVAATTDQIVWFEDEGVRRIPADAARVSSLCRIGSEGVLYASVTGELVRRRTPGAAAEPLADWRKAAGLSLEDASTLELCRLWGSAHGVMARTSAGRLLVSTDAGTTFRPIELRGKVLAMPRSADACLALVRSGAARYVISSTDAGATFRRIELDNVALSVAGGDTPSIATAGPVIALADPVRGLCVSADSGAHFVPAPGCIGATALAVGRSAGRWLVIAALHREVDDVAYLVVVDPVSGAAERVAELAGSGAAEAGDTALVKALCFEQGALRLWAAGGFGVTSWSPDSLVN